MDWNTYIAECTDIDELQDIVDNAKDRIKTIKIYLENK